MIHFPCSSCHYDVSAPDDDVGKFMLCPSCFARQRIPPPRTNETIETAQAADQIYELYSETNPKKYKETIPMYCPLCHTFMHAAPERIGSHITCPDCGTKTLIRPIFQ